MFLVPSTKEGIIRDISNYMCGEFSAWCIGISDNPDKSLFEEHNASEKKWICMQADDFATAREIEKYFLESGCEGVPVEGNEAYNCIYAFKK